MRLRTTLSTLAIVIGAFGLTVVGATGCDKKGGDTGKAGDKKEPGTDKKAGDKKAAEGDKKAAEGDKKAGEGDKKAAEGDKKVAKPVGPPKTIKLWHAYRGDEKKAFEQLIGEFNTKTPHIKVQAQAVPYDAFVDKVTIVVPRGQGPDLFVFAHNMVGNWVDKKVIAPIGDKVPGEVLKQFLPQSVKALVYRKNLYGLPLAFKSLVLFCNKKLLPEPPSSMEELITKLKPLLTKERYGLIYEAGGLYQHATWVHAFGGSVFDAEHKPAFQTEAQVKALKFARSLFAEHKLYPKGVAEHMITTLFNEQKAVCTLNGPWFRAEINKDVDYVVRTVPTVEGKPGKPFLGIESLFVTTSSKNPKEAVEVARFLTSAASAKVRLEVGKQPVAHAATLAASKDPHMAVFKKQVEHAVLMDSSPEMQVVWATADGAIGRTLFVDGADPKAELAKAQKRIEADLARRQK